MVVAAISVLVLTAPKADAYVFGYSAGSQGDVQLVVDGATVNATHTGWYDDSGNHDASNLNYVAANPAEVGIGYRDFFVFDLTGLSRAESATLRIYSYDISRSEVFALFEVQTAISSLINGTSSTATYADLGSGVSYGNRSLTPADSDSFITIDLNSAFLSALNSTLDGSSPQIALGGVVTGIPVPEPASLTLMGLSLAGLGLTLRRKGNRLGAKALPLPDERAAQCPNHGACIGEGLSGKLY